MRKIYEAPMLKTYGTVEDMTKNAPSISVTDVPVGTAPNPDIDDITS
ncbi:hypothetical protein [Acaryochloris sp. IP29b_bin.137]|nr:hypothetical protein [Acaryochloris sp. IP29b_bin.137]